MTPAHRPDLDQASLDGSRATVRGSAEFSPCLGHRHRLDRWWSDAPRALVCGCNPSTAGAQDNDATIHQVRALTARLPIGGFTMVNWCDRSSTDPDAFHRWRLALLHADEAAYTAIRDANLAHLRAISTTAAVRIVAWGNLVPIDRQTTLVLRALSLDGQHPLYAFGLTGSGAPKHPLARGKARIVPGAPLVLWRPADALRPIPTRPAPGSCLSVQSGVTR